MPSAAIENLQNIIVYILQEMTFIELANFDPNIILNGFKNQMDLVDKLKAPDEEVQMEKKSAECIVKLLFSVLTFILDRLNQSYPFETDLILKQFKFHMDLVEKFKEKKNEYQIHDMEISTEIDTKIEIDEEKENFKNVFFDTEEGLNHEINSQNAVDNQNTFNEGIECDDNPNEPVKISILNKEEKEHKKKIGLNGRSFTKHMDNFPELCILCDLRFTDSEKLKVHEDELHKDNNAFKCSDCEFESEYMRDVEVHFSAVHKKVAHFSCEHCDKIFIDLKTMLSHLKIYHDKVIEKLSCPICLKKCLRTNSVWDHMESSHSDFNYECHQCGKVLGSKYSLSNHVKNFHEKLIEYSSCHICGKKMQSQFLESHIERHLAKEKTFFCDQCQASFYTEFDLKKHKACHRHKDLVCDICGFKSNFKRNLERHRKYLHEEPNERPFKCEICGLSSKCKSSHRNHMKTHSTERKFACDFCGKGFKTPRHLKEHIKIHTGEKAGHCNECGKDFAQKYNYKLHMLKHHQITV